MNFNVYLNREIGEKVTQMAKTLHRSRNSIVNEALEEWLNQQVTATWPKNFFDFAPIENPPDFKSLRTDLQKNLPEDPLA